MTDPIKPQTARRIQTVLAHLGARSNNSHHRKNQHDDDIDARNLRKDADVSVDASSSHKGHRHSQCGTCVHKHDCSSSSTTDIEDLDATCTMHTRTNSLDTGDNNLDYLFDLKRFDNVCKPLLEASTLPPECYNSPAWFHREMSNVFFNAWTLVGRVDEITEPGEYLATDTEWGGPVAACRGEDGKVHAFANVCCHRGAKVLQGSSGRGSEVGLVCPYHAWTYGYDGALKFAPGMKKSKGFKSTDVRLTPLPVSIFHGFVFVSVQLENTPSLESLMGDLPEHLPEWFSENGSAQDMVCAGRREYDVNCNWKFLMENTCETYHTSIVHADSLGPMRAKPIGVHQGDWDAVVVPSRRSIVPLPSDAISDPLPSFANRTAFVNMFPSLQINVTWDCLWWMRLHPTSPTSTHIQMGFCFPKSTVSLPSFPKSFEIYKRRWHIAVTEDNAISLNQARGVRSVFRVPGRFCQLEFGTHNFNNWLLSKMLVQGEKTWDPGSRSYVVQDDEDMYSNDDVQMTSLAKRLAMSDKKKQ